MFDLTHKKIVFGGGCHWCTEAVFQSLIGVANVNQGWASHTGQDENYSEAAFIEYDPKTIPVKILLEIHLKTHSSTSNHSMRDKYRSAIYVVKELDQTIINHQLLRIQSQFKKKIKTQVLTLAKFKQNEQYQNYYYRNPEQQFCDRYIRPKIEMLFNQYQSYIRYDKVNAALKQHS